MKVKPNLTEKRFSDTKDGEIIILDNRMTLLHESDSGRNAP